MSAHIEQTQQNAHGIYFLPFLVCQKEQSVPVTEESNGFEYVRVSFVLICNA